LDIGYDYQALANVVTVSEVPEHLKKLGRVRDDTAYGIQHPTALGVAPVVPTQSNWTIISLVVMYCLLMSVAVILIYRYRPARTGPPPLVNPELIGLNGWLVLVAIGLLVRPVWLTVALVKLAPLFSLAKWNLLTTPGTTHYKAGYAPVLLFELLVNLTLLFFSGLLAVLFFQRRSTFPRLFIALLVLTPVVLVADHVLTVSFLNGHAGNSVNFFRDILVAVIWVAYTVRSERVKGTFVN
jgi:hypothetical protein